ncbi:MAG TPA: Hsp20/alpha crystallin family protein [Candidatus Limnocylindrales bacterium]|nr:Hsp20/alpha crystallin family protein [Candidatus Limnocylindrales bacterium]
MTEDKKKMYYYGGKEKKAGEVKKKPEEMVPYAVQNDFDRMIERFQRQLDDFWEMPPRLRRWMSTRPGALMMPFREMAMPNVDLEDRGKDFCVTVDLPGFKKEDVNIEVSEDSVMIQARRAQTEEEKDKNYIRRERGSQTYYRRIDLPEKVVSDNAKASLNNGVLEIILPKKEPKETKKLTIE